MELSGGQFLPPVQTLVATLIFARLPQGQKCKSSPVTATGHRHKKETKFLGSLRIYRSYGKAIPQSALLTAPFTQGSLWCNRSPCALVLPSAWKYKKQMPRLGYLLFSCRDQDSNNLNATVRWTIAGRVVPVCGARCAPWWQRTCVAHRPRHLLRPRFIRHWRRLGS